MSDLPQFQGQLKHLLLNENPNELVAARNTLVTRLKASGHDPHQVQLSDGRPDESYAALNHWRMASEAFQQEAKLLSYEKHILLRALGEANVRRAYWDELLNSAKARNGGKLPRGWRGQAAQQFGLTLRQIQRWETGEELVPIELLQRFRTELEPVSTDGSTPAPRDHQLERIVMQHFVDAGAAGLTGEQLNRICKAENPHLPGQAQRGLYSGRRVALEQAGFLKAANERRNERGNRLPGTVWVATVSMSEYDGRMKAPRRKEKESGSSSGGQPGEPLDDGGPHVPDSVAAQP